jgi:hypothetical protein
MRQYVNYFRPSFKLVEKTRNGSAVVKPLHPPATPCDRVIAHEVVKPEVKARLVRQRAEIDHVALLHSIREAGSALAAIVSPELRPTPRGESLASALHKKRFVFPIYCAGFFGIACGSDVPAFLSGVLSFSDARLRALVQSIVRSSRVPSTVSCLWVRSSPPGRLPW